MADPHRIAGDARDRAVAHGWVVAYATGGRDAAPRSYPNEEEISA